ncbi:MAG: hypothetical protein KC635_10555, partial [Myxococcales bacterium]|nr:hypothetical protein [Myxococcales bacterium]
RAERLARARPARAVVRAHAARGIRVRGPWSALELELEVHPPEGHKYVAKTCWAVLDDQAPALAPGQPVAVKVDREDPQVVFPDVHDARYSWSGATQMRNRPVPG